MERPPGHECTKIGTFAWPARHAGNPAGRLPPVSRSKPERTRKEGSAIKPVASNRKAFHDYFIEDRAEAGLVLTGTEVKSLRAGRAQLKDSYVQFRGGEAYLVSAHISPYGAGSWTNHLPERERKLLLHRRELDRWAGAVATRGVSCVPLSLYFKGSRAKAEIALVKGKKLHDKRDSIRDRELRREADRAMRRR
jgi:SsrA-binding protein